MKVIFSHGKESGPQGEKIKLLSRISEAHGFTTESVDYTDLDDPDERVKRLISTAKDQAGEITLVGSSMGGYVSLVAADVINPRSVFLLAPALYMDGYEKQSYPIGLNHTEIVHGWSDDVIPPEHSIKYAKKADCSLHLIRGDHRLDSSLKTVASIFEQFLSGA